MGYQELIASLRTDGEEKVRELRDNAQAEADKINAEAADAIARLREESRKKQDTLARHQAEHLLSSAGDKARAIRLEAEQALAERLFSLALSCLAESGLIPSLQLIERSLTLPSGSHPDLRGAYSIKRLEQAENTLKEALFKYIFSMDMHHLIRGFFTTLANTVNLLSLYKYLKWEVAAGPAFIEGGSIRTDRFHRIIESRNSNELVQLIYKQTGLSVEDRDGPHLESMFNRYLTGKAKRMGRDDSDIGFILNYLWRCYMEARNLSVISYGKMIDKAVVRQELAY